MILQVLGCVLALLAAYLAYLCLDDPPPSPQPSSLPIPFLPSLLIPCITLHRRYLPATAIHHFSYPLLYLGLDLDALETHALDRGVLKYDAHPARALLTVNRGPYLANPKTREFATLREELLDLVCKQGVEPGGIGRIWLVTMPSSLGFTGINPLTVWFLYDKAGEGAGADTPRTAVSSDEDDDDEEWVKSGFGEVSGSRGAAPKPETLPRDGRPRLKAVVLEVHNTFGERHIYVLRVGHAEESRDSLAPGLHHAWTFPRTFHVSPFNNRAGYYRLEIADPFRSSPTQPKVRVALSLLTKSKQRKLYAVLAGNSSAQRPPVLLTSANVTRALFRQPLDLLLTSPRILAQAWTLHFEKRLSVYPRPELDRPRTGGEALDAPWNPAEEDEGGTGRSIGWKASGAEKRALALVGVHLEAKSRELGTTVSIYFDNPGMLAVEFPGGEGKGEAANLVIRTRHPTLFTEILMARTPDQILLSAEVDRHTLISSADLFRRLFATPGTSPTSSGASTTLLNRAMDEIRRRYLFFHTAFALRPLLPALIMFSPHWTTAAPYTLEQRVSMLWLLLTTYWAARAEEWIMFRMGARFVGGQAPWDGMRRIADHVWGKDIDEHDEAVANDQYGSVLPVVEN